MKSTLEQHYMGQVMKLRLSCYLVLLSIDSKTRLQDSHSLVTWPICCLCYTANTMPIDALATLGARASAGMVLTPKSRNIPSPSSEELNSGHLLFGHQQKVQKSTRKCCIHVSHFVQASMCWHTNILISSLTISVDWCQHYVVQTPLRHGHGSVDGLQWVRGRRIASCLYWAETTTSSAGIPQYLRDINGLVK